ncbi:lnt [Symbiodinium sp. CCMP2592]|nr:lnt [Symbiodinium sp. CCMP2592]
MSRDSQTSAMTTQQLLVVCGLALLTRFFTNLEAIPGMSTLSMACCCVLAEAVGPLWLFLLSLVGVGIMQGLSTWGYLQADALLICVLLQIPLSIAYLTHRRLVKLHPESAVVTLAFPCINTALWILSFFFLPIGSIASPAYDLAGQALILTQCAAWFGRSGVTFVLSWLAAAGAHRFTHPSAVRGWRASLLTLFSLCLAGGVRYYAPTTFMGMQFEPPGGEPQDYYRVSCISMMRDMYGETQKRLEAGDTIVMHSEVSTPASGGSPVPKYQDLLQKHYQKTQIQAVVVLCYRQDGRSWYNLVSKDGSAMSYAKNHPVPVIEAGLKPGDAPPSVASVQIGSASKNTTVTGTICFDTDFPSVTRPIGSADMLLESSATWSNIGRQHLHGHQYAALENGQTLVKCTYMGFSGAINPYGSIIIQLPQTKRNVVYFQVPRFPKAAVFPWMYTAFDIFMGISACVWLVLALSPEISSRVLGDGHL